MKKLLVFFCWGILLLGIIACSNDIGNPNPYYSPPPDDSASEPPPNPLLKWKGIYKGTATVTNRSTTAGDRAVELGLEFTDKTDTLRLAEPVTLVIDSLYAQVIFPDSTKTEVHQEWGLPFTVDDNQFFLSGMYSINFTLLCRFTKAPDGKVEGTIEDSYHGEYATVYTTTTTYVTATRFN